jgi:ribonuclease BN (tRNA processing enzyme)
MGGRLAMCKVAQPGLRRSAECESRPLIFTRVTRRALAIAPVVLVLVAFRVEAQATPVADSTRVVMLGTGTPNADPDRSGPAVAIVVDGHAYIVDAGPGVVRRAAAAMKAGTSALRADRLDIVFLTHLHSDHTLGLPDLLFSPWVLGRASPLRVFGPHGTAAMVEHISAAWAEDIHIRLTGGEPGNKTGYRAVVTEVDSGVVFRDSNVTVTAFRVAHGTWDEALGYKFVTKDRVIVISGDTHPTEAIVAQCNGCDVLVHEVYVDSTARVAPQGVRDYYTNFHTSTLELADLANRARPKLLLLYHQLYSGAGDDNLLREIKTRYAGPVMSAHDLGVY